MSSVFTLKNINKGYEFKFNCIHLLKFLEYYLQILISNDEIHKVTLGSI